MNEYGLIKIFNQLYVGFQERQRVDVIDEEKPRTKENFNRVPYALGFITPYEDNAAGRKRQETVDRWAKERNCDGRYIDGKWVRDEQAKKPEHETRIIPNDQLAGFKLAEEVRRTYWGGGNVVWRIEDPRGFEIEISSANLARIIEEVGILPGGVIPGKCIYGRLGKDNIIIPEGTELWNRSVKDAEELSRRAKSVSKNQVQVGSVCELKNGSFGTYLGQFYVTTANHPYFERQYHYGYYGRCLDADALSKRTYGRYSTGVDRYHAFRLRDTVDEVLLYKEKNVITVLSEDERYNTTEKTLSYLNGHFARISYASSSKNVYSHSAFAFTVEKPTDVSFVQHPISKEELESLVQVSTSRIDFNLTFNQDVYRSNIIAVNEEGLSLASMKILVKTNREKRSEKNLYYYDANSIRIVFPEQYILENGKLKKSLLDSVRDNVLGGWNHENSFYGEELATGHEGAYELLKETIEDTLKMYKFNVVKLKVNDTEVYLKGN